MPKKIAKVEVAAKFATIGENIRWRVDPDTNVLTMKIKLDEKGELSSKGNAYIIAKSSGFKSIKDANDEEVGFTMVVTRRKVKKASKKAARDDDDED
jgi:hypothetical protein